MTETTLFLVRHGETAWNRERRVMGRADVPLSDAGRTQSERLGRVLAGMDIARILSSPLARAVETAEILAGHVGCDVEFDEDLEEVRYGDWQGRTYDEIATEDAFRAFAADPENARTPGGETIGDVQRRGLAGVSRARAGERTLVVSHGDILRSILCSFLAVPLAEFRRLRTDNCGVSVVAHGGGQPEVKFVNVLADPERAWDAVHWASWR